MALPNLSPLHLGCVPAILMPEDITALMMHKDNMGPQDHWLVSLLTSQFKKQWVQGLAGLGTDLLLWKETPGVSCQGINAKFMGREE